ncbi:methyltransferase [Candidatus Woesearchaeota archaeon]|nr:methyltransferase [Candidatus Woesearchaeota archaeon]
MDDKKDLTKLLSKLKTFIEPDSSLEQYPTDPTTAANILWEAFMNDEIEHHLIADFGAGTGILGIGALAMGAEQVIFIEIDPRVFPILMENLYILEKETKQTFSNYKIIEGNVEAYDQPVEVVLQNPPFGTRKNHIDTTFLKKAIMLAPTVYTLHKTSTIDHVKDKATEYGGTVAEEKTLEMPLKNTMPQHIKDVEKIEVTLLKITS